MKSRRKETCDFLEEVENEVENLAELITGDFQDPVTNVYLVRALGELKKATKMMEENYASSKRGI